jgi:peptide deformylase
MWAVPAYSIRTYGDPILRQPTVEVTDIDGALKQLTDDMIGVMYAAPGVGLAAPQIGVQKRVFVYDAGDGPFTVINPRITESSGEWTYDEGCLSVPGLSWPIVRPRNILLEGLDIDGNALAIEAEEYLARVYQHEIDHLDGVLLIERLDPDLRKQAMATLRQMTFDPLVIMSTNGRKGGSTNSATNGGTDGGTAEDGGVPRL